MRYNLKVEGMTCANCAKTIENTLKIMYPFVDAKVNISANKVILNYDETKVSINKIANTIKSAGYNPVLSNDNQDDYKKHMKRKMILSSILSLPLLWAMLSHVALFNGVYVPSFFKNGVFQLIVAGVVQFYIGKDFYIATYKGLKRKVLGMDILVVIGTTSAYIYSSITLYNSIFIKNPFHPVYYFEISAVIITMILIGNYIEHIAKNRTSDAIKELAELGAKKARVIENNKEVMKSIDEVNVGDVVLILSNEKVPIDGVITEGITTIDESMITGESMPIKKEVNSKVVGATINLGQTIKVKTTKIGSETMLSNIITAVEQASSEKPPIQRVADKVASYFVPIVLTIAIINFIIWIFVVGSSFNQAFETTIAILVLVP